MSLRARSFTNLASLQAYLAALAKPRQDDGFKNIHGRSSEHRKVRNCPFSSSGNEASLVASSQCMVEGSERTSSQSLIRS
eukprot:Gb_24587 [translate_table: standard]